MNETKNGTAREEHGYETQWELLRDLSAWADLLLYDYYSRHQWVGPDSELRNMLGLVVSQEEFEHHLSCAARRALTATLSDAESAQLALARRTIAARIEASERELPLPTLFRRFALDEFERGCVALAWLCATDKKYEKLFAYLQDDMTQKTPGKMLLAELLAPCDEDMERCLSHLSVRNGFTGLFDPELLRKGSVALRKTVLEYLSSGTIAPRPELEIFRGATQTPDAPMDIHTDVAARLDALMADGSACSVVLVGETGAGRRHQLRHLMARRGESCVFASLPETDWEDAAIDAALAARLTGSWLCFCGLERRGEGGEELPAPRELLRTLEALEDGREKRFYLSRFPVRDGLSGLVVALELPRPDEQERLTLFQSALRGIETPCEPERLAATFRFTPAQIVRACNQAQGLAKLSDEKTVSSALLHRCCYAQAVHKLGDLASRTPAAFTWDDLVLPEEQKRLLRQACRHIRYQHQVYHTWHFDEKVTYGRGLSILFAGVPGTGKTMCAQIVAAELEMELYKINLSQIVSKYIGETEKNLRAVFTEAKNANCILFFDECDALFGKRSEVKDAHDRNANVEVAYLLQQVEEYDGVCILATNLIGNIDDAFMRRMTYVVRFPFPDKELREQIYRRKLPDAAPRADDIDWAFLAEKFELSGGHIKNIVLAAAFMAAGEGTEITMRHLLLAAVNEMRKNGIVVVREQLREYADLLDEAD